MNCPNDGTPLVEAADPMLKGCLVCPSCDFVQGFGTILVPGAGERADRENFIRARWVERDVLFGRYRRGLS